MNQIANSYEVTLVTLACVLYKDSESIQNK